MMTLVIDAISSRLMAPARSSRARALELGQSIIGEILYQVERNGIAGGKDVANDACGPAATFIRSSSIVPAARLPRPPGDDPDKCQAMERDSSCLSSDARACLASISAALRTVK